MHDPAAARHTWVVKEAGRSRGILVHIVLSSTIIVTASLLDVCSPNGFVGSCGIVGRDLHCT
jgi:hypothetical protein